MGSPPPKTLILTGVMDELESVFNRMGLDQGIALPIEPEIKLSTRRWRFLLGFSIPIVEEISG
jgi:hypothetical protein